MDKIDLTLPVGAGNFCYRVSAIIMQDDKLLMVKNSNYPYYYSVGGRVHFGEASEDAILREVYEETNVHFAINRLGFIHENFFIAGFNDNLPYHEISLHYFMKPNKQYKDIQCNSMGSDGVKESLHWLPIDTLSNYEIYPPFFKTELQNENYINVKHFLTKDETTYPCL